MDGQTLAEIESAGLGKWLAGIREELRTRTYRAQPVRRAMRPKPGGGERPLGIPTIRDRVVQAAAKLVLEPIFEADMEPCAYGYRPKRSAQDAIRKVHELLCAGYTEVVDADLSKYFDTIPHGELMQSVARRIVDRDVLRLIKQWLKVPVEERDEQGKRRMTGGKNSRCGTPQGGVISPLLANLYMNRFLKYWRITEQEKALRAHVVNYADDFVILTRRRAGEAREWTRGVMAASGPDPERSEDQNQGSLAGGFRLSGILVGRAALSEERWPQVSGSVAVEEERGALKTEGECGVGSEQYEAVAGSARWAQPSLRGLVGLLPLWYPVASVPRRRSPCGRACAQLPEEAA